MAYITFYQRLEKAIKESDDNTVIICERSLESCRHIFSKILKDQGKIDDINYQILEMFYNITGSIPVDAIIYLDITSEVSIKRIEKRARLGEDYITIDYLEKCRESHDNWIKTITSFELEKPLPVLTLKYPFSERDSLNNIDIFIKNNCYTRL
jgi:deoxyadenosine/deoxycytidine kinase